MRQALLSIGYTVIEQATVRECFLEVIPDIEIAFCQLPAEHPHSDNLASYGPSTKNAIDMAKTSMRADKWCAINTTPPASSSTPSGA